MGHLGVWLGCQVSKLSKLKIFQHQTPLRGPPQLRKTGPKWPFQSLLLLDGDGSKTAALVLQYFRL